jgi:uncharacterized membrane protein
MFCSKCGTENKDTSKFCRKCGAPLRKPKEAANFTDTQAQPVASTTKPVGTTPPAEFSSRLQPNIAGLLCYILGWLTGIIFLFVDRNDKFVRFHAWQSIVTFGILTIAIWVMNPLTLITGTLFSLLSALYRVIVVLSLFLWIFLMFSAFKGKKYALPLAGSIARKLAG